MDCVLVGRENYNDIDIHPQLGSSDGSLYRIVFTVQAALWVVSGTFLLTGKGT